jgi:hypothetical protein
MTADISLAFPSGRIKNEAMIAAAVQKSSWSLEKFAFNWFDVLLVVLVIFGLWRGRKHGMSREFLPVSQWVVIVVAGGFGYGWVGDQLMRSEMIKSVFGKNFTDRTAVFLFGYLLIATLVLLVFVFLRRHYRPKLEGSAVFGAGEYYLGMVSGVLRCACILIAALALLNAPVYTPQEIELHKARMMADFGLKGAQRGSFKSDDITGDYLPYLPTIQSDVFKTSLTGPFIKDNLGLLLINSVPAAADRRAAHF